MYSRSTDRGGRRIKLPPGYDGNAFRHDTGEVRRIGGDTEMKIHSPVWSEDRPEAVEEDGGHMEPIRSTEEADAEKQEEAASEKTPEEKTADCVLPEKKAEGSFLEGLLASLGSEDLLLILVILLLLADGSDAWDLILLLGVLLAVK